MELIELFINAIFTGMGTAVGIFLSNKFLIPKTQKAMEKQINDVKKAVDDNAKIFREIRDGKSIK